ncbi:MAG: SLC13 family permease, partial [Myxococcota bacterium]|nr:SLC13 family permease [Myxococcota bacterium]
MSPSAASQTCAEAAGACSPAHQPQQGSQEDAASVLASMDSFSLATVKSKTPSASERWMKYLGFPAGVAAFLALYYMPTPEGLGFSGQVSLAAFAMALIWWTTEPFPTFFTSIALIVILVLFNGWNEKLALGVLGLDVIWLNIMAFILASMMVKTRLARRLSLFLIVHFGRRAGTIMLAFLVMQVGLAALIPATAARAVMTLPLMLTVAAIYGSTSDKPNNFGRAMLLQNLHCINTGSAAYVTGSSANLIAVAFILSMGGIEVFYSDWFLGNAPIVFLALLGSWWGTRRVLFRMADSECTPQLAGGLDAMRAEYEKLGPLRSDEWRTIAIFAAVLFLWTTDRFHEGWFGFQISAVMAAAMGALFALAPRIGVVNWNETDIPWHLMLFSAGAYAGGLSLRDSGAARFVVA